MLQFGKRISSIEVSKQKLRISHRAMSTTNLTEGNPSSSDSFLMRESIQSVFQQALVPVQPSSALVPVQPSSALVPVQPSSALVPVQPSSALVPVQPSSALVPVQPSSAEELTETAVKAWKECLLTWLQTSQPLLIFLLV